MLVDQRTYTLKLGTVREFLTLYAREGLPVQVKHLGAPLGFYTTETGELNQVVHCWQYQDMADRERRRSALEADVRWLAYRQKSTAQGQLLSQHVLLLRSVDLAALAASV